MNALAAPLLLVCMLFAAIAAAAQPPRPVSLELRALGPLGGSELELEAVARIDAGWHVNTDRPSFDYLIPSQLGVEPGDGWQVRAIHYPPALLRRFTFAAGEQLRVWEHRVVMRISLVRSGEAAPHALTGASARLRYQACSDRVCLPPAEVRARLSDPPGGAQPDVARRNN